MATTPTGINSTHPHTHTHTHKPTLTLLRLLQLQPPQLAARLLQRLALLASSSVLRVDALLQLCHLRAHRLLRLLGGVRLHARRRQLRLQRAQLLLLLPQRLAPAALGGGHRGRQLRLQRAQLLLVLRLELGDLLLQAQRVRAAAAAAAAAPAAGRRAAR
jgi:hypothetical protein